jgi:DNA-binding NarL/FixJ family response regulator
VLSQYAQPAYALALLDAGSTGRGYLLKERVHDGAQLRSAIETVAGGGSVIDPKVVELLVAAGSRSRHSRLAELTPRERELRLTDAQDVSKRVTATLLFLAEDDSADGRMH